MRTARGLVGLLIMVPLIFSLSNCSKKATLPPRATLPGDPLGPAATIEPETPRKKRGKEPAALSPERLEAIGDMSLQTKDYESSLVHYLEILKDNPTRYDLRYKVGVIFFLNGQYEAARRELAFVLINRPEMLEAHEALGLVHLQEKKFPLAMEEFRIVLAKDPRRAKTRELLGISFLEAGQTDRAIAELKQALDIDSRQVSSYVSLGQAYMQKKLYPQAVETLKKGQALAPQNQKINYHLGIALAALKRYPEALETFKQAGDEAQGYNNIGVHYFMDGKYEEAAKCFQRAIELRPTFYGEAKANLQRALEKLHQSRKDDS